MPASAPAPSQEALTASRFEVQIDGIAATGFAEVSGIEAEIQPVEVREGNGPSGRVRVDPGERRYGTVVLRRAVTSDAALWNWMKQCLAGDVRRRNVSVTLLDDSLNPVVRWNFANAWPSRYEITPLNTAANEIVIETVEICHEGLDRA